MAALVRSKRLVIVLRRVSPRSRMLELVDELASAGARVFEITLDAPSAADDLRACRDALPTGGPDRCLVGAGTVRELGQLDAAYDAGADFGVSPVLNRKVVETAIAAGLPFVPGAYTPTEADQAWQAGATFVKLFPASSLGASHVRELRGPLAELQVIVTGGVDATNARGYLDAGAAAVGIGNAILTATPDERRSLLTMIADRA